MSAVEPEIEICRHECNHGICTQARLDKTRRKLLELQIACTEAADNIRLALQKLQGNY